MGSYIRQALRVDCEDRLTVRDAFTWYFDRTGLNRKMRGKVQSCCGGDRTQIRSRHPSPASTRALAPKNIPPEIPPSATSYLLAVLGPTALAAIYFSAAIPTQSSIDRGTPCAVCVSPVWVATIPPAIPKNRVGTYRLYADRIGESTCAFVPNITNTGHPNTTSAVIPSTTFQRDLGKA